MKRIGLGIIDVLISPFVLTGALLFKRLRGRKFYLFPIARKIMFSVGVYPINDYYYEPLFNPALLKESLRKDRALPGMDFNIEGQLQVLRSFDYNGELLEIPLKKKNSLDELEYCYTEGPFQSGDAEYLYNMIRLYKPKKLIEIGSGYSTLLANKAINKNIQEMGGAICNHICVEPYENKWLEKLGIEIIRKKVEDIEVDYFKQLGKDDILFIDSSHMIRPQGDVLFEYLNLLPILNTGVIIHIHDIFTPKDYLNEWIDKSIFWNEQYLLEAFLSHNKDFEIIGATNFLLHNHRNEFYEKCPIIKMQIESGVPREPGSFWIRKIN